MGLRGFCLVGNPLKVPFASAAFTLAQSHQRQQPPGGCLRGGDRRGDCLTDGSGLRHRIGSRSCCRPVGCGDHRPGGIALRGDADPDFRTHRSDDRGVHVGHHQSDRHSTESGNRPGDGVRRRHLGGPVPDPVRTVPAGPLRHDDALHGDLGLHVRHRDHPRVAATWAFSWSGDS